MERDAIVMLVARNLKAAMERKDTNPSEVARRAGINPTGVYDILSGKSRSPRLDTLHKIAVKGLGMPFHILFADPAEDRLDQELLETIGMMASDDRRRFLAMARAAIDSALPA
jgi:transcriptional regulator with XRE-family HTH domain